MFGNGDRILEIDGPESIVMNELSIGKEPEAETKQKDRGDEQFRDHILSEHRVEFWWSSAPVKQHCVLDQE